MRAPVSRPAAHNAAKFAALSPPAAAAPPSTGAANNDATVEPTDFFSAGFADLAPDAESPSVANAVGATA